MTNRGEQEVVIERNRIKFVSEYTYLGQKVAIENKVKN